MEKALCKARGNPGIKFEYMSVFEEEDVIDVFSKLAGDDRILIIIDGNRRRFLPELLRSIDKRQCKQFFFISEARALSADHELIPRHRPASAEELEGLRRRKIPFDTLPKIKEEDAIVRWNGWEKGSVLAIDRDEGVYFRMID